MAFSLVGGLLQGATGMVGHSIDVIHRTTDATLDKTGLSAFIPPAVHEISDGTLGLVKRTVLDVGKTGGGVLRSFDQKPLHAHDKSIGGNLKKVKAPKKEEALKKAKASKKEDATKKAKASKKAEANKTSKKKVASKK